MGLQLQDEYRARLQTYQLPLPPPCFLVLDGASPAYPALPKYFGKWSSGAAVPLARPAWLRSVSLWERVTFGFRLALHAIEL
jgi:hypothetical protein